MTPVAYRIQNGVRRAVAVRQIGSPEIPARIVIPGQSDQFVTLPLDMLYSPKATIVRDARYIRNTEYPTAVLGQTPPAIEVEPIFDSAELVKLTPLRQVALV